MTTTTQAPGAPSTKPPLRRILELAARAPSVHNTQPWSWRSTDAGLELHADRTRQLRLADPLGRNLVISCGATLHHLQVVAAALGWLTEVDRVPDASADSLLACIQLRRGEVSDSSETDLKAIVDRCTDRRRFTSWPVPDERLQHLADVAGTHGVRAVPLIAIAERFQAELLVGRAIERQDADPDVHLEQQAWVDHSNLDGIPSRLLGPDISTASGARAQRFSRVPVPDESRAIEGTDGLIVLCSGTDDVDSWLKAGKR